MIKKWPLAIGLGAGLWGVMFIGVSALMVSGLPDLVQQIFEIVLAGVVAFILARLYFKKAPGDLKAGAILFVLWLAIETALDLLITVQFVKASGTYASGLKSFYGMWSLWVSFVLMLVGVELSAKITHGGELMKTPDQNPASKPVTQGQPGQKISQQPPVPQQPPTPPAPPSQTPPAV